MRLWWHKICGPRLLGQVLKPFSVSAWLVGLTFVVLTPFLVFTGLLVIRSAEHEEELMATAVRDAARSAVVELDQKIRSWRWNLMVLTGDSRLQTGDYAGFQAYVATALKHKEAAVVLSDAAGQEVIDTRVPFGEPLPRNPDQNAVHRVLQSGEPFIAGMMIDPISHLPILTINVPVKRLGVTTEVLSVDIAPLLQTTLAHLGLPAAWIAAISDREGYTIARTRGAEQFVGQKTRGEILHQTAKMDEGWFPTTSREGIRLYSAFGRIKMADWMILIGIPYDILFEPLRQSTRILVLTGSLALITALGLAAICGRSIAAPIRRLVHMAETLGRNGSVRPVQTRLREVNVVAASIYAASQQLMVAGQARDRVAAEIQRSERQYRSLARKLSELNEERVLLLRRTVLAEESERRRIARELHDSFGQYLTALRLGLNTVEQTGQTGKPMQDLKRLTADLAREVDRMAWEIRPAAIDDLGLCSAVRQYIEQWSERSGLRVDLEIINAERRIGGDIETTIFRTLQEAFTNVVRHAAATEVSVILDVATDAVRLIVEDNGLGMGDPASPASQTKRLGLIGVRERLALVNGNLEVESSADGGTTLFIQIPIC